MPSRRKLNWFGIRTIYHFGTKPDGTNVFEERICVFSAKTDSEAFKKAQKEADEYARVLKFTHHPVQEAYFQDGDALIDGYEVWSQLFEFNGDLDAFVRERYGRFEYHVDPLVKPVAKRKPRREKR